MENKKFKSRTRTAGHIETNGREIRFNSMITVENFKHQNDTNIEKVSSDSLNDLRLSRNNSFLDTKMDSLMADFSAEESDQDEKVQVHPFEQKLKTDAKINFEFDFNFYDLASKNVISFIKTPGPKHQMIKCKVFIKKAIINEYFFYLELPNAANLLLMKSSRNAVNLFSNNFLIDVFINKNFTKFGKLQFNLARNNYFLTGISKSSQNLNSNKKYLDLDYNHKIFGKAKPKQLTAEILISEQPEESNDSPVVSSQTNTGSIACMFEKKINRRVPLATKKPVFDEQIKKYKLDFDGRAFKGIHFYPLKQNF